MTDIAEQLADTQRAFDSVADDYDGPAGNNALVQVMRARTMTAVMEVVPAGASILDLGCGTGLDAIKLAGEGYRVTAIDWSPRMARRTAERAVAIGVDQNVVVHPIGIHQLDALPAEMFDAAYSNLGALNCVPNLVAAARLIRARIRPGGYFIASVIGRFCPWEIGRFSLRREWSRVRERFGPESVPVSLNGQRVWTRYYTPTGFKHAFELGGFRLRSLRGLGLLMPPPYMIAFADRHPLAVERLRNVEDRVAGWPGLRNLGDHFLIVMQRGV